MVTVTLELLGRTEKAVPLSRRESRLSPHPARSTTQLMYLYRYLCDVQSCARLPVLDGQLLCCAVAAGLRRRVTILCPRRLSGRSRCGEIVARNRMLCAGDHLHNARGRHLHRAGDIERRKDVIRLFNIRVFSSALSTVFAWSRPV